MGAVNYFTSDYITLGVKPYSYYDLENDQEFMNEIKTEVNEYGGTIENAINNYIDDCYECDYENIKSTLEKYSFYYYHVVIKPGYYEGFTIDIENNYGVCFNDWTDRREAQKEITQIKKFLIECAGLGLVACSPGWCPGYKDYNETIKAIKEAVKEMRDELQTIPTWNQYNADQV